jgi:hypothetical protein
VITDSLRDDWFEANILVSRTWPEARVALPHVTLTIDVMLKQSAQLQFIGGTVSERTAIITANIEHWPDANNYPSWEQRARIERIEALTSALITACDWIMSGRRHFEDLTLDARKAATAIGVCHNAATKQTSERMRCAGYYRESLRPPDAIWNDPSAYPLDAFEDRRMCMVCHYPIGSWEHLKWQQVGLHENCAHYIQKHGVEEVSVSE